MKKKDLETLQSMDISKLDAEGEKIRVDIAKLQLDQRMGNMKDSNAIAKNKKRLAVVQTLLTQKRKSS